MKLSRLEQLQEKKLPNSKKTMYYVAEARKSTKPEDRQAASIPRQLQGIEKVEKQKKIKIIKTFIDKGTGWIDRDENDEFYKMIEFIESRDDIEGIICYDSSRLTRNDADTGVIKKLIIKGKIKRIITVVGETFDINNLEYFGFKSQNDFNYSLQVSKNVKRSVLNRIENGIPPYGPKTGYRYSDDRSRGYKTHEMDKSNFFLMKKVFDLFLTGNFSVYELQKKAVKLGLKNTRGRQVTRTRLYEDLKDVYYTGRFLFKDKLYPGTHKRMITDEEFELIQEILENSSRPRKKKNNRKQFVLNGFVVCGECGMAITGEAHKKTYKNGKTQKFNYYRCTKKHKTIKCKQPYIKEKDLEKQITDYLSTLKIDDGFVEWCIKWLKNTKDEEIKVRDNALKALQNDHKVVIRKLDNLFNLRLEDDGVYSQEEIDDKRRTLKLEKKSIEENMENLFQRIDDVDELTVATFKFAQKAQHNFENGTLNDKKNVMKTFGSNLVLKDKKLNIQPRDVFIIVKDGIEKLNSLNERLEPDENTVYLGKNALQKHQLREMRGLRNEVRTYYLQNKLDVEAMKTNLSYYNYA